MAEQQKQVFYGRVVHSKSLKELEILPRAALGVTETGLIDFLDSDVASAEQACEKYPLFKGAQCATLKPLQFLFPGFIDTHLHAPQSVFLFPGGDVGTLREWVENYTDPIEASYKDNEKAKCVYSELVQQELNLGTTTCAYNSSPHFEATNILSDMCKKYGQRAIIGKMSITMGSTHGNWEVSTEQSLKDAKKSVDHILNIDPRGELVLPCIVPRGGSYMTAEGMAGLGKLSKNDGGELIRVQAHMCETLEDFDRMKKVHPKFGNYSEMYKEYGLLHERSIVAHCIHLSDVDVKLLATTKAGVAHNPNSNTCLRDGECQVRHLLRAGIKVGLGTDCSAGYTTSMLDSMRQASNVSRHLVIHTGDDTLKLDFEEIVYLGTMGSAAVVGLEDKIGSFEPGKYFDALLVDVGLSDQVPNVSGWEEDDLALVKKFVFMGDDRNIRKVFVNGKMVAGKDR